ncbi:hypothetical protein [Tolumonas lignilytica]|uniref:hypothetical protein n=1 Tax=Tolumonas lignilytica TaxID=1283284 RepID=UPI000467DE57|nr:hypothetical protein [Tolumonas lignilytica]
MSQNVGTDANFLINMAAKQLGVLGDGQTLSGPIIQDCFALLNMMLNQFSEESLTVYQMLDLKFTATGAQTYSVGSGGDVPLAYPPVSIVGAESTLNNVVTPLRIVQAKEDFRRIALPGMQGFPKMVFLDTGYPLATLYVWPIPTSAYTITLQVMQPFTEFQYLTDAVNLRPSYKSLLMFNLACWIAPIFGIDPPATVVAQALNSKRVVSRANAQVPLLQVDQSLLSGGHYNIYADRSN